MASSHAGPQYLSPVLSLDALQAEVERRRSEGCTIAWTNGCFDILHVGHIVYLAGARAQADVLVVGLNSDESVRAIKGPERPIVTEQERAAVLSALRCVDYVTIFGERDAVRHLDVLRPDVYVKGGDYTMDTINQDERRFIEGYGGKVVLIPGVTGRSSTAVINSVKGT